MAARQLELVPSEGTDIAGTRMEQAEAVLQFLNQKTNKRFAAKSPRGHPTSATLLIYARLDDGYSVEDMRSVIALRCRRCLTDRDRYFMRPMTLFRKSNFEADMGELE